MPDDRTTVIADKTPSLDVTPAQQRRLEATFGDIYKCVGYEGTAGYLPGYKVGFLDGLRLAIGNLDEAIESAEEYAALPLSED